MITRKKQIFLAAVFFVSGLLFIFGVSQIENSSYSEDTAKYTLNEYTGELDFNDPEQEPEQFGRQLISFRNADKLLALTDAIFTADVGERISEYVAPKLPEDKAVYILESTLTSKDNFYTFTIEAGTSKNQFFVEVFETRQGFANIYIDNNGPYNFIDPFYDPGPGEGSTVN